MTAQLLAGAPVAEAVLADAALRVEALVAKGVRPGLGTILVGDDGASAGYVRKKHEMCEQIGMRSVSVEVPAEGRQEDLLAAVRKLNEDDTVHGYLVQHPVPAGFDLNGALLAMDPEKD